MFKIGISLNQSFPIEDIAPITNGKKRLNPAGTITDNTNTAGWGNCGGGGVAHLHSVSIIVNTFFKIKLPIAIRQSLPAYGNEMILMLKGTSLASTVTLLDLTGVAKHIISTTFRPVEVFIVAGSIYLLMTFIIHNFIKFLEKKYNYN